MKAGIKTTEFWLSVISSIIAIVGAVSGLIPAELAAKIVTVLTAIYAGLRTLSKSPEITTLIEKK